MTPFSYGGLHDFDVRFMETVYEKPFEVIACSLKDAPDEKSAATPIGTYFRCAIALYTEFYDIKHVLIMSRVASGEDGTILLREHRKYLIKSSQNLHQRLNSASPMKDPAE